MGTKKIIVVFSLLFCFLTGVAQDIIIKRDGSQLTGKVLEITETVVKYKKADNPDGPLYSISVDDIVRINYENGNADIFVDDTTTTPASVLAGNTGKVSDTELYKMYKLQDNPYKVPNRIRTWGFIGGGAMVAAGVAIILASPTDEWGNISNACFIGIGVAGAGIATMTSCYFISQHKRANIKKKLYSAQLFRQDVLDFDDKALSIGVDLLADRDRTRTLGLGMTFKF